MGPDGTTELIAMRANVLPPSAASDRLSRVHDLLIAIVIAIAGGVVATALWSYWAEYRRKDRLQTALGWIPGHYAVTLKSAAVREPETLTITLEDNRLIVKIENLAAGGRANGQIIIDERHPTSGKGFYIHDRGSERMWGFWDVQLRLPSSILVHTTYVDNKGFREVFKGYVWDRVAPL